MMFSPKPVSLHDQLRLLKETERILEERTSYVEVSVDECERCCTPLELTDTHRICNSCGFQAEQLPIENNYDFEFSTVSMTLTHKDSNYTSMLSSINKKFTELNHEKMIPEHTIRDMAYRYVAICKQLRNINGTTETKKRCSSIKYALLWDELGASAETYIGEDELSAYLGITSRELIKSYSKLLEYHRNGFTEIKMISINQSLPLRICKYLSLLNVDIDISATIVKIIGICNDVHQAVEYRTCENKTRYASVVWVVLSQIGIVIAPEQMTSAIGVSKSTYERYVEFIYQNRKIINPWLVHGKVRPILRSFALKKQGRRKKVMAPLKDGNPFIWKGKQLD